MKNFRNISILICTVLLVFACSSDNGKRLASLKQKQLGLKAKYDKIGAEMKSVQAEIAALEGNKSYTAVTAYPLVKTDYMHYIDVQGKIESDQNVTMYPEAPARVLRILVQEGQKVASGQVIASLDSKVLQENLKEMESSYDLAKTMFERQERLWKQKIGSEAQYLEAKNSKTSLEQRIAALKEQISMYNLKAPFSGTVDRVFLKVGEMAGAQNPAVRIVNLDKLYAEAEISEKYLNLVKEGMEAEIDVEQSGDTIRSTITSAAKYINPSNRTFRIKMNLPGGVRLAPNQLVKIRIMDKTVKDAIVVPSGLVQQSSGGEDFVFTVGGLKDSVGAAQRKILSISSSYGGNSLIDGGLSSGDVIIDKGSRTVREGQKIRITK